MIDMRGYGSYNVRRGAYPLPPPQLAPGLPRGNEKGGIFDADWLPARVVNASYPTVPADSPHVAAVPQRIDRRAVGFREITPQPIAPAAGYGAYVTNGPANRQPIPIHSVPQPGAIDSGIFGSYVVGPMRPIPIPSAAQVMEPHAVQSGVLGAFGLNDPPPVPIPQYHSAGATRNGIFG
jgi:hypothetical protein